jgi:hypothetical protein
MRVVSRKWLWIAASVLTVIVTVAALSVRHDVSTPRYRHCGHRQELRARLLCAFPYWQRIKGTEPLVSQLTIHGCSGDRAVGVLERLNFMQRAFHSQSGRYAYSLSELEASDPVSWPAAQSAFAEFRIEYETVHDSWCAYIPGQADLPGHYLVLSSGVYFCEARRPTTNDTALAYFK